MRSAASVRNIMPDVPIALFLDEKSNLIENNFDYVTILENPTYSTFDKVEPLVKTPFLKTLFLDTDTLVIEPVYELSALLERFDLAYCHAPWRYHISDLPGCNEAFPQCNSGVLLYKSTKPVFDLFRSWDKQVKRYRTGMLQKGYEAQFGDQLFLRRAVFESSLNTTILPPEYNLRTLFPFFAGGRAKVKILHGRGPSLSRAQRSINENLDARIGNYNNPWFQLMCRAAETAKRLRGPKRRRRRSPSRAKQSGISERKS